MHNDKKYLITKSTTKTVIPSPNLTNSTKTSGSSQAIEINAEPQFPFEIYYQSSSINFDRFDGDTISTVSTISTSTNNMLHVVCQKSSSNLEIYINGVKQKTVEDKTNQSQNKANLYIGNKGGISNFFTGSMSQIMIFDDALSQTQINNLSEIAQKRILRKSMTIRLNKWFKMLLLN